MGWAHTHTQRNKEKGTTVKCQRAWFLIHLQSHRFRTILEIIGLVSETELSVFSDENVTYEFPQLQISFFPPLAKGVSPGVGLHLGLPQVKQEPIDNYLLEASDQ